MKTFTLLLFSLLFGRHGISQDLEKAMDYFNREKYDTASMEFEAAIPVVEKDFGVTDTTVLTYILNYTGQSFQFSHQYEKAERYYLRAKLIFETMNATQQLGIIATLNNLACLYEEIGSYEKAEPLYLHCLEIDRNQYGEKDTLFAIDLNNLATFYLAMGRYAKAEPLMKQAIEIAKNQLGENHPEYLKYLNNLAQIYRKEGNYDQAEPLMVHILEIAKKTLGEYSLQYAKYLSNLGHIYYLMGLYTQAEPLYLQALEIAKTKLDVNHPSFAIRLNNLAALYIALGRFEEAEPLCRQALEIDKKLFGTNHPEYARVLNNLALLYWETRRYEPVEHLNMQAFQVYQYQIKMNTGFLTEKELDQYLSTFLYNLEIYQSFNNQQIGKYGVCGEFAYDIELNRKGLLLKSAIELRTRIRESGDTSLINNYYTLFSLRKQINDLNSAASNKQLEKQENLQELAIELEKSLALKSKDYRKTQQENELTWKDIQKNLKPGEAAVEFSNFHFYDGKKSTDSIIYCAIVLREQDTIPQMLYLCEETKLKKVIPSSLAKYSSEINFAYNVRNGASTTVRKNRIAKPQTLYNLVWEPLDSLLGGIKTVYFAPSGILNSVSFAAIFCPDNKTLTEKYNLVQFSTTRTLALPGEPKSMNNAVVYGGIIYDTNKDTVIAKAGKYRKNDRDLLADNPSRRGDTRAGFRYLPGTRTEAELISGKLEKKGIATTTYIGTDAVEESFGALSGKTSPSLIHLSTHGFYYPDTISDENRKKAISSARGEEQFKYSDDPLLRSGLLMAGSNLSWKGLSLPSGVDDGILTAQEVSNMNLMNTQLVVLSACQTGLGDVKGSEGVEGLQRGFKMAGARYIIMSLWEVPDKETTEFMSSFYDYWLGGKNIRDAFRATQMKMKNKYKDEPYKWAGFVLME